MKCEHCGANLSLEDLTRPNCPYCRHVLKHHAQAAEHAALVNKIMEQQIGAQYPGIPRDQIPQIGYQYGAPMNQSFGQFQQYQMNQAVNQAMNRAKRITMLVLFISVGVTVLLAGLAFAVALFVAR